jgi:hypothetical protein
LYPENRLSGKFFFKPGGSGEMREKFEKTENKKRKEKKKKRKRSEE